MPSHAHHQTARHTDHRSLYRRGSRRPARAHGGSCVPNRFVPQSGSAYGCDWHDPGYGFQSENAKFAALCRDNGAANLALDPIRIRGSKRIVEKAGVPTIPGYHDDDQIDLLARTKDIGFPVMIKAVMGGSGKGMRISHPPITAFLDNLEFCYPVDLNSTTAVGNFQHAK